MTDDPRTPEARKRDVLARLSARVVDAWVATSDGDQPHLVPLTLAWHDERILLATARSSRTARNLAGRGRARLGLGPTRDVVLIDAVMVATIPVAESGPAGEAYAAQNDWDPRSAGDAYDFLALRPERIQAWREENEIPDRALMRDGVWLV